MNLVASVLLLASVAFAAPQFQNVGSQGITADQRALYLPVMRALLKVMEAGDRPTAQDINSLLVATRELNNKVPKGQNLLGGFGSLGGFGGFDISGLENMGLPETGDIVTNVAGQPHVKTTFGAFPLSDTSLMTAAERAQFLPVVRTFTSILEKGNADPNETNQLLGQIRTLNSLIPANMRANIEQITGLATSNFGASAISRPVPAAFNPTRTAINPSRPIGGSIPTSGITPDQRATYLPVMRALLRVMESNIPAPEDINNLLIATRELNKKVPKGGNALAGLGGFGGLAALGSIGQFGFDDETLQNIGLPETGDIVTRVDGVPHIRTSFGIFPLTSTSLMTPQERQQFLPVVRSFTSLLEKGSADANEANALLAQAQQLTSLLPANFQKSIQGLTSGFNSGRIAATPSFNNLGSFPSQGITADQRATYLPVMRALLKVMSTSRPAAQDINSLLIATRELNKKVPKGSNLLGGFGSGDLSFGIDNLEGMGLPQTGDVVTNVAGVPHIKTTFGIFPLSDTSLMTEEERQQFLPVVRTFTSVLEKGNASPTETNTLVQQVRQLNQLIPANIGSSIGGLIGQISG